MELVRGSNVTTYCDNRRLNISERLEVFQEVGGQGAPHDELGALGDYVLRR